ncbi:MAG: methyltransferase domain-containing protein [Myxococcales bacterium]|nr:methyltransferase domain-containing protein [Myxococcales bacterium]
MDNEREYHDAMIALLQLVWGDGFMAPGGEGNVANMVQGLDVRDKSLLDIGCGIGGPAFVLAKTYGARVVSIDIDAHLVGLAKRRCKELGLEDRIEFRVVEPGPLDFPDNAFDFVVSSGAFTQIENKLDVFKECLRVLKPGGVLTSYDWMKGEGEYSKDMLYWFKIEGLTYAMETPARHEEILRDAGFIDVEIEDRSSWYRQRVADEYEKMKADLYPRSVALIGREKADHFVENWRAMKVVCEKGEMLQVYFRARKPA